MLQSLDIVTIQVQAEVGDKRVRRCKQIVEIVDIDAMTKEILTNEVFRWDPVTDEFFYSGKSYILERIRGKHGLKKEEMINELKQRVEILDWMKDNNIRAFKDVARMVTSYFETPKEVLQKIRKETHSVQKQQEIAETSTSIQKKGTIRPEESSEDAAPGEEKPSGVTVKKRKKLRFVRRNADSKKK
jgi:hypothetical protein